MSPFDKFLLDAEKIRAKYKVWIERRPEDKEVLLKEMNDKIAILLDECDNIERQHFKTRDQLANLGIKPKALRASLAHSLLLLLTPFLAAGNQPFLI